MIESRKRLSLRPHVTKLFRYQQLRFLLVGSLNTLVDFTIYTLLRLLGVPIFFANIVSTSCGLAVSYTLNRSSTFGSTSSNRKREVSLFIIITLVGLWILQPLVIFGSSSLLRGSLHSFPRLVKTIIPKLIATLVSLAWNYTWYRHVVFRSATGRHSNPRV